jgi:hypothetical protein
LSRKKPPERPASSVLRETVPGQHTLVIHGAISCARVYVEASRHLASLAAAALDVRVDASVLPDFPLYKEEAAAPAPAPVGGSEAAEEGEEAPRP